MYNLACFHALVGDKDPALDWLGKAVEGGFHSPGRIAKDSDLDSLRDEPQYKKALAMAKTAANPEGTNDAEAWVPLVERLFNVPGILDYTASVTYTEGYSTHTEEVAVLVPGARKNPLYSVFGERKPMAAFDRYLPEETVSFSICNGVDLDALYSFVEDTIRSLGPKGEEILGQWAGIQEQVGLNVRKDTFGWIEGSSIEITIEQPMGNGWVIMLGVSNEDMAREKIAAGMDFISNAMQQAAQQNPMLGMMAVRTSPLTHEKLSGFHNINIGLQPQPIVCGVAEGHIILASSADAVVTCMATAAGEHPNIRKNSGFRLVACGDDQILGHGLGRGPHHVRILKFENRIRVEANGKLSVAFDDPVAGVANGTKDHTLVRKSSVCTGNPDWITTSSWFVSAAPSGGKK
jgi:hypothetical protein